MSGHDYTGKTLAVILIGTDEKGEDEWNAFFGTVEDGDAGLFMDRGSKGPPFEIRDEWLGRIEVVPEGLQDILGHAEFMLPLTVGDLPPDADERDYLATGLKTPIRSPDSES